MSEVIRSIRFEHFRGLPNSEFKLNGKSLVLLGSNGKGKSAIVDGIEFVFSGQVSRFVGSGTVSIDHNDAVKHVKKLGTPKVTTSFSPSNGKISRSLDLALPTVTDKESVKLYFDQHSRTDAFILRRAKILDFIYDQDADRYRKLIKLLGVTHVDTLQRSFVDAERQAKDGAQRAKAAYLSQIAVFRDPVINFEPRNINQVLARISDTVQALGLEKLLEWSDAEIRLPLLKAMRPEVNKEKIDALTRALVSLETPLPLNIGTDIATANTMRNELVNLGNSSVDAPRSSIITEASAYLKKFPSERNCPLCEKQFGQPLVEVLSRLKQRSETLRELREAIEKSRTALSRVPRYAEAIAAQLEKDLKHSCLLGSETTQILRNTRATTLRWLRSLKRLESSGLTTDLVIPPRLLGLPLIRSNCAGNLKAQKLALAPPDSSKLEAAITLLQQGIVSHAEISTAENAISGAEELSRRASIAKDAFSKARELSIQKVFNRISETVLNFYRRLHNLDEVDERSECTALEMKPTSRSSAGGLRLAIQFLGLVDSKDPRAFLSEGHIDSLGLCLFLATARIFNPPGTLLVLDDVLTSSPSHKL